MSAFRIASVVGVLALLFAASPARARTMSFDSLPSRSAPDAHEEDGISAIALGGYELGIFETALRAHLDDGGTSFARSITFTMATRFTPVSFELFSWGTEYCPPESPDPPCQTPYDVVGVVGYRDGAAVFEDLFTAGESGVLSTYSFPALAPIDSLVIRALRPDLDTLGGYCLGPPCGHFDIDNVVLVPEPIALSQLAAALVALGLIRGRRA